jgi:thioredoxin 1
MKRLLLMIAACAIPALWLLQSAAAAQPQPGLPRLLDLGSKTCVPCQLMEPILAGLKTEFEGKMQVDFVDVGLKENLALARNHKISVIPTQIFFDAEGRELWRHEGFMGREDILDKWKELCHSFGRDGPILSRLDPARTDTRRREDICYMCENDVDPRTRVIVQSEKGPVHLRSPHCYFVMYSCLLEDKTNFEQKVSVTDLATGRMIPAATAHYLYGMDEATGRPTILAFADRAEALRQRQSTGGNIVSYPILQRKELAHRCGFCDRACYPEDAALVKIDGVHSWGCCSNCSMGVAARTGRDIEVHQPDGLTGQPIIIRTYGGSVLSIEPPTAVAWFGQKRLADGRVVSSGCFHQNFFINEQNLRKWVEQNPLETGSQITISRALRDKMKMTPQQIENACKIGQCAP